MPLLPADRLGGFVKLEPEGGETFARPSLRVDVSHAFRKDAAGRIEPFSQFDGTPFGTATTRAYTVVDVEARTTLRFGVVPLSLTVGVDNVTDEVYRDFLDTYKGYALSPGRNLRTRISAPFEVAP